MRFNYPLFDWLRFLLASVVVLGHANFVTWDHAGNLAVQVFFALSGFLIGGILLTTRRAELPHFFFNRATRIWIPTFSRYSYCMR
jgi:peptidoglycan/LPS O-acetylase OafA/YrhL